MVGSERVLEQAQRMQVLDYQGAYRLWEVNNIPSSCRKGDAKRKDHVHSSQEEYH